MTARTDEKEGAVRRGSGGTFIFASGPSLFEPFSVETREIIKASPNLLLKRRSRPCSGHKAAESILQYILRILCDR